MTSSSPSSRRRSTRWTSSRDAICAAEVRRQGRHLRELGPGDFFGEMALLDGGPRTATVTALGPMKCLVLSRGEFHNVIRQNALIAVSVLEALGDRLRALLGGQPT